MDLQGLSAELLLMIFEFSSPYDFENFALTCKRFYAVAAPLVKHHNKLRRKYHRFSFLSSSSPDDLSATQTVVELLAEIAEEPIIASYIVHADLGNRTCTSELRSDDDEEEEHERALRKIKAASDKIATMVIQSEHLALLSDDPRFLSTWVDRIIADEDEYTTPMDFPVAFLLSLLPNIESLTLSKEWRAASAVTMLPQEWEEDLDDLDQTVPLFVQSVITRANDNASENQPLQKLRILHPTQDIETQFGTRLASIFPFLALDSLREAYHSSGKYQPDHDDIENGVCSQYPTIGRQLEVVELTDCVMNAEGCRAFFKGMQNLKTLTFEYATKDEIGYYWDIDAFFYNLVDAVGGTLEKLSVTTGILGNDSTLLRMDLHGFKALLHLELDTTLFIYSSALMGEMPNDELDSIEPLVDSLPSSLITLSIYAYATAEDIECLKTLFDEFQERRDEQLPSLGVIKIIMRKANIWGHLLPDCDKYKAQAEAYCSESGFISFQLV
ncbi:hypothetical protein GQ53DRAFT_810949 [Thozetella sp. PMI_491]|nr:hypothetical protein GQ53DRAFT_810949 [Thozetella sp. PMI_491]